MSRQVQIARMPMSLPCPVPVLPGTSDIGDGDMSKRTECCAVDAYWAMGSQVTCDVHLRVACGLIGVDFDEVAEEMGGLHAVEMKPWAERYRYEDSISPTSEPKCRGREVDDA